MSSTPDRTIYSNHAEQRQAALPPTDRAADLEEALVSGFEAHIDYQRAPFIVCDRITASDLATALVRHPIILKSILASVNVASRAIKRDLGFNLHTYKPVTPERARALAVTSALYVRCSAASASHSPCKEALQLTFSYLPTVTHVLSPTVTHVVSHSHLLYPGTNARHAPTGS